MKVEVTRWETNHEGISLSIFQDEVDLLLDEVILQRIEYQVEQAVARRDEFLKMLRRGSTEAKSHKEVSSSRGGRGRPDWDRRAGQPRQKTGR